MTLSVWGYKLEISDMNRGGVIIIKDIEAKKQLLQNKSKNIENKKTQNKKRDLQGIYDLIFI